VLVNTLNINKKLSLAIVSYSPQWFQLPSPHHIPTRKIFGGFFHCKCNCSISCLPRAFIEIWNSIIAIFIFKKLRSEVKVEPLKNTWHNFATHAVDLFPRISLSSSLSFLIWLKKQTEKQKQTLSLFRRFGSSIHEMRYNNYICGFAIPVNLKKHLFSRFSISWVTLLCLYKHKLLNSFIRINNKK